MGTIRAVPGVLALLFAGASQGVAGLEVAAVFGPEMVLQRGVPVPVWGRAEPGETVTVAFAGQRKAARADQSGRWLVTLGAMRAGAEPRPLTVRGAAAPVAFENVRVGEVWLLLAHRIPRQYSVEGPVPLPQVRLRGIGSGRPNHNPVPRTAYGQNRRWLPGRSARLDALSIPFANRLCEALGVPVGIVRVEVGGLEATTPPAGFAAVPALRDIASRVETWDPATKRGRAAYGQWLKRMKRWREALSRKIERSEPVEPSQPPHVPGPAPGDAAEPTVVYNRQLHALTPLALRGALHVHEEHHVTDPPCTRDARYADKMRALIAGLRSAFGRPGLAFAFSQRNEPSIYHQHTVGGELDFNAWAGHRDRQRRVLPHEGTGMVVTLDVENHPGRVGERFARWALSTVYGRGGAWSGPTCRRHRVQGDRVILEFDHADGGLMAAKIPEVGRPVAEQKGAPLRSFAVAGEDRVFHRAEARIAGDTVVARSRHVKRPVAVRYACRFDPRGMNLYNRAGLPASPFRTDDWPIPDFDRRVEDLASKSPRELTALLGDPAAPHSHAAAKALAARGEAALWPIVRRLAGSDDPDRRCGALRALGYLYWLGPVPRRYYDAATREVTPAVARAIGLIGGLATDADPAVRRCAAEALGLIGAANDEVFTILRKLATDDDALVRTAALRMAKYRLKSHAHTTALAYALLADRPFGDCTSTNLAANLLNHYRLKGPIDVAAAGRFLRRLGPRQGGGAVGDLGDLLRRLKAPDGEPSLNRPDVLPAVLHLYALGYRNYMLYGVERWITLKRNVPAFARKVDELRTEIERLRRDKPRGWRDLSRRYEDAVGGLTDMIEKARKARK